MYTLNAAPAQFLLHGPASKVQPRLVEEGTKLVPAGYPDHHRSCISHIPKTIFTFTKGGFIPVALGDAVDRSNQMSTLACIVEDRCDADFASQPSSRVVRRFFPQHRGFSFDCQP